MNRPATGGDSFTDSQLAVAAFVLANGSTGTRTRMRVPLPGRRLTREPHVDAARRRVLDDVGEPLLEDAEEQQLHRGREAHRRIRAVDPHLGTGSLAVLLGDRLD